MKLSLAILAVACTGAYAQSTVSAPCGTDCPSAVPDKTITRSKDAPTESTPCPSLIVSSKAGAGNGTNQMVMTQTGGPSASPTAFTGGAAHAGVPVGAVIAVGAALLAL